MLVPVLSRAKQGAVTAAVVLAAAAPPAQASELVCGQFECSYEAKRGERNRVVLAFGPTVSRPGPPGEPDVQEQSDRPD